MTKMKSKKMTKSTFAIIIMAVAMVAMLAFGGTYAYFTATATGGSVAFNTGYVKLNSNAGEAFVLEVDADDVLFPHEECYILGSESTTSDVLAVTVDTDDAGNYVAVKFVVKINEPVATSQQLTDFGFTGLVINADNWIDGTTANDGIYFYNGGNKGTSVTAATSGEISVVAAGAVVFNVSDEYIQDNDTDDSYTSEKSLMGAKISIEFEAHSIQSTGLDAADVESTLVDLFA